MRGNVRNTSRKKASEIHAAPCCRRGRYPWPQSCLRPTRWTLWPDYAPTQSWPRPGLPSEAGHLLRVIGFIGRVSSLFVVAMMRAVAVCSHPNHSPPAQASHSPESTRRLLPVDGGGPAAAESGAEEGVLGWTEPALDELSADMGTWRRRAADPPLLLPAGLAVVRPTGGSCPGGHVGAVRGGRQPEVRSQLTAWLLAAQH